MSLAKLGKLFEAKYLLISEAETHREKFLRRLEQYKMPPGKPDSPPPRSTQTPAQIIAQVKRDIINMYDLYVNSNTAKEPVLQMLSDAGESFSKDLVKDFERLISNIKRGAGTIDDIYEVVKAMRDDIKNAKSDKSIRQAVHDAVRVTKESEKNYREHVKSKFEMILTRIYSILDKQAKLLHKFIPDAPPLIEGIVAPQRKELSKEKLLIFMKSPAAQKYGLDNINVMEKILFYPELKERITTLINAVDRGRYPVDGPEIAKETAEIMAAFKLKETNEAALEQSILPNTQLERALIKQKNNEIKEKELALKYDPSFVAKQHETNIRNEEILERNREMEREEKEKEDLINKYNSLSFSDWLKRSSK